MSPEAVQLCALMGVYHFEEASEESLQRGVALVLDGARIRYEREARLNEHDRVDFLIGRTGMECKTAGSWASVVRQLHRYAQSPMLDELLLLTTRAAHRAIPEVLGGKPVRAIVTMGGIR